MARRTTTALTSTTLALTLMITGGAAAQAGDEAKPTKLKDGVAQFHAVPGPAQRWYVENVDLASVRDFCGDTGAPTGR